jgi:hypothetical protein
MLYLCPQRGCSGTFQLDEDAIGSTVKCRKCGAILRVEIGGLGLVEGSPVAPIEEEEEPRPPARLVPAIAEAPEETPPMSQNPGEEKGGLVSLILFGVGAVLVILFLFLPLTDFARAVGKQAAIDQGDARQKRKGKGPEVIKNEIDDGKKTPEKDAKSSKEEAEKWARDRKQLQEEQEDARYAAMRKQSFYTWGMLLGFLILAVASILFLSPSQPRVRRVVGGVVITTEMLLVFFAFLINSSIVNALSRLH